MTKSMSDSQALLQEGLAAFRARAYDEALRAWRTLLSFEPDHPQVKELVARTESLAAEGQMVNQLKEELDDLREELAITRDSRNELLLEMARLHKRYEEREARLWRLQEAREWELREALANAELKALEIDPHTASLSEDELAKEIEDGIAQRSTHEPIHPNELQQAREQVKLLRSELHSAHERIVELEQELFQYQHDEHEELQQALEENRHIFDENDEDAIDDQQIVQELFVGIQAITPPRDEPALRDAPSTPDDDERPRDPQSHTDTQSSRRVEFSDAHEIVTQSTPDAPDFDGPLIAEDVLNRTSTSDLHAARIANPTQNLRSNLASDIQPKTGSFPTQSEEELLDHAEGVSTDDEPVIDALVGLVIEETSGMIHAETGERHIPDTRIQPADPPNTPDADDAPPRETPFLRVKEGETVDTTREQSAPQDETPDADAYEQAAEPEPSILFEDALAEPPTSTTVHEEPDTDTAQTFDDSTLNPLDDESNDAAQDGERAQEDATQDDYNQEINALPRARTSEDVSDTAEFDSHPIDDKNIAEGFMDELAEALDTTPPPPRIETGIQPELPELSFEEDDIEAILPEDLERRATWIPVRYKVDAVVEDPIAQYLLTHIDGVSTFMELRGTVGLPPAAVDSGFRHLLAKDIIRAKPR